MTLPPGKRQRRQILSEDDEPIVVKTRRAPPRLASGSVKTLPKRKSTIQSQLPGKPKAKIPATASSKSSPKKPSRGDCKEEKESKSLHTFFGRATEEQRWARKAETPTTVVDDGEAADAIEDDSLDEAFANFAAEEEDQHKVLDRRKIAKPILINGVSNVVRNAFTSSQRFAKSSKSATQEGKPVFGHDEDGLNRPWAERFAPTSLGELAVHKKKVTDVQNWLSAVLQGRDRRVCDS